MMLRATDKQTDEVRTYLEWQLDQSSATKKKVAIKHVEKVAAEHVGGSRYEVWNCITSQGKWWVVTPMNNFYTQKDFESADVVLTFHVGLTARILSRDEVPVASGLAAKFPEVWRKWDDAVETMYSAQEPEDYQAAGMRLRESIVSLLKMVSDDDLVPEGEDKPQGANPAWLDLLADRIASGSSNTRLRSYLKNVGAETWKHVNWLTHATSAQRYDAEIAIGNVSHLISVFTVARVRYDKGPPGKCAKCGSYRLSQGVCDRCHWEDEAYVSPEPTDSCSPEEQERRLATPCILSSDISTFMSPRANDKKR